MLMLHLEDKSHQQCLCKTFCSVILTFNHVQNQNRCVCSFIPSSLETFISVNLFLLLDDETQLLNQGSLQALNRLATSENTDLQTTAALYYLHLSHHCE